MQESPGIKTKGDMEEKSFSHTIRSLNPLEGLRIGKRGI